MPTKQPKVVGSFGAGGVAILLVWVWSQLQPENPLPAEVAAAFAALLAGAYGPVVRWLQAMAK